MQKQPRSGTLHRKKESWICKDRPRLAEDRSKLECCVTVKGHTRWTQRLQNAGIGDERLAMDQTAGTDLRYGTPMSRVLCCVVWRIVTSLLKCLCLNTCPSCRYYYEQAVANSCVLHAVNVF